MQLWREKRCEADPQDLSSMLPVMLGSWTEGFNRQWYEALTGDEVTRAGEALSCSQDPWRRCTLDGFIEARACVFEAKHTSTFVNSEQVLERYMPQLQHNMSLTGASRAVLSVIFGNQKYEVFEVDADWLYQRELYQAEHVFWNCVLTGKRPVAVDPPAPPRPVGTREVCLEGNNHWASAAVDWLQHRESARTHASACALIKDLVEPDVKRAFGHGIEAKRSKSGAITIRELV
jgi:predicted phage-related endonuclease